MYHMADKKHQDILSRLTPEQAAIVKQMANTGTGGIEKTRGPRLATYLGESQLRRLSNVLGKDDGGLIDTIANHKLSYVDKNGNARFWLPDDTARLNTSDERKGTTRVIDHPLLEAAMGDKYAIPVSESTNNNVNGTFVDNIEGPDRMEINIENAGRKNRRGYFDPMLNIFGTMLHEMQHNAQAQSRDEGEYAFDGNEIPYEKRNHEHEANRVQNEYLYGATADNLEDAMEVKHILNRSSYDGLRNKHKKHYTERSLNFDKPQKVKKKGKK